MFFADVAIYLYLVEGILHFITGAVVVKYRKAEKSKPL